MKSLSLMMFVAITLLSAAPAHAGGWTQKQGSCYAKLWNRIIVGDGVYGESIFSSESGSEYYADIQLNLYAECGILPELTVTLKTTPIAYASTDTNDQTYVGPIAAGFRYGLINDGPTRLSIGGAYSYAPPLGDRDLFTNARTRESGRPIHYIPALENHFGELTFGVGHSFKFYGFDSWFSGDLSLRFNSKESIDHALLVFGQWGVAFSKSFVAEFHVSLYEPYFADIDIINVAGVGQTRYLGFGLGASYWPSERWGFNVGVDGVVYAASNAATPSFSLGVESKWPDLW